MYEEIDTVTRVKSGWGFHDVWSMSVRQRRYWAQYAMWELERRATLNA